MDGISKLATMIYLSAIKDYKDSKLILMKQEAGLKTYKKATLERCRNNIDISSSFFKSQWCKDLSRDLNIAIQSNKFIELMDEQCSVVVSNLLKSKNKSKKVRA